MLGYLKKCVPNNLKRNLKDYFLKEGFFHRTLWGRVPLSHLYLKGEGIEIGALHQPLSISKQARVKYVDRYSVTDLRHHYPELHGLPLVNVDIIDNGEQLGMIANDSQSFVVANHFVEHCQNPFQALSHMFRVLKKNGILYMALPDKRYTFDIDRPITPLEHILKDYYEDPEPSKKHHFEEWVTFISKIQDPVKFKEKVQELLQMDYSIHFHVWTQTEMLEMMLALKKQIGVPFDIEVCLKNQHEFIFVLRKN